MPGRRLVPPARSGGAGTRDLGAVAASLGLAGAALAVIGVATSVFTGRGAAFSALRQLIIGYGAAGITFAIGKLVGVSLGG